MDFGPAGHDLSIDRNAADEAKSHYPPPAQIPLPGKRREPLPVNRGVGRIGKSVFWGAHQCFILLYIAIWPMITQAFSPI